MKLIILIGAPGAGKGTQAVRVAGLTGLKHMSTGEMLRNEVEKGSPVGHEIGESLAQGNLVSDALITGLVQKCIKDGNCGQCQNPEQCRSGFVLDGFPRNINQAVALDEMMKQMKRQIDHVVYLDVEESILLGRIQKRATESGSSRRSDDTEQALIRRLDIFRNLTKPLVPFYEEKGLLRRIDGMKPLDTVTEEILEIVSGKKAA